MSAGILFGATDLNLADGIYSLTISIADIKFIQESQFVIQSVEDLSVAAQGRVNNARKTVAYTLQASTEYLVEINGVVSSRLSGTDGILLISDLVGKNIITIRGLKECQGALNQEVNFEEIRLIPYPNPSSDVVYIKGLESGTVMLFDIHGRLLFEQEYGPQGIDMRWYPQGQYVLRVFDAKKNRVIVQTFKITKR
jgi:hypothetical protein